MDDILVLSEEELRTIKHALFFEDDYKRSPSVFLIAKLSSYIGISLDRDGHAVFDKEKVKIQESYTHGQNK